MATISEARARDLLFQLGEVFTPSAPVDDQDLFAGRNHELMSVVEAMQSAGQHVIIYGERGVGKTSLARIAASIGQAQGQVTIRLNCDAGDTFDHLWKKVADELTIRLAEEPEWQSMADGFTACVSALRGGGLDPSGVRVALRRISQQRPITVFFDEFNEVADSMAIAMLANTIKSLSDHIERVTLGPVGVAEDLDALLEGHLSAVRAIVQVKMPRMSRDELKEIVARGLSKLGMVIDDDALAMIEVIPRGLPQYAHLLAQEGARHALLQNRDDITRDDVMHGLKVGLAKLDRSLSKAYERATYSPKKTRFKEVLLACSIARLGDMGDFSPSDIRLPYSKIIGEQVGIDRFNPQLTSLATNREILIREGEDRRWRYRFKDPLMEPYVLLEGLDSGAITPEDFPH
jgi:energy-coupling factor transporter ATP-binding protein EcfA2